MPTVMRKNKISLEEIKQILSENNLVKAREILSQSIGATVECSGTILKTFSREGELMALIQTPTLKVFAAFDKPEFAAFHPKFKKKQTVEISGVLNSFGFESVKLEMVKIIG